MILRSVQLNKNGIVISYAASTNQGISRNYNEDRVSIILNIKKPKSKRNVEWPRWAFFGIFDGHGGTTCSDYLRDCLHLFIINNKHFPSNPRKALIKGFKEAEDHFLLECAEKAEEQRRFWQSETSDDKFYLKYLDWSGSCVIIALIVEERWYIANVGDSRAIMSADMGDRIYCLSIDHKPTNEDEIKRIVANGGKIYQTQTTYSRPNRKGAKTSPPQIMLGPPRVKPGRLSVSRTFGDIEAKVPAYGGNPNVVIAVPEIIEFDIRENYDYILLGWDGVFDKLENVDIVKRIWTTIKKSQGENDINKISGLVVDDVLKDWAANKSMDNITWIVISFKDFIQAYSKLTEQQKHNLWGNQVI